MMREGRLLINMLSSTIAMACINQNRWPCSSFAIVNDLRMYTRKILSLTFTLCSVRCPFLQNNSDLLNIYTRQMMYKSFERVKIKDSAENTFWFIKAQEISCNNACLDQSVQRVCSFSCKNIRLSFIPPGEL